MPYHHRWRSHCVVVTAFTPRVIRLTHLAATCMLPCLVQARPTKRVIICHTRYSFSCRVSHASHSFIKVHLLGSVLLLRFTLDALLQLGLSSSRQLEVPLRIFITSARLSVHDFMVVHTTILQFELLYRLADAVVELASHA